MADQPHAARLRAGRRSLSGHAYVVTACTAGRRPVFCAFWPARAVVRALAAADRAGSTRTLAYILMPDHLHWLFVLRQGTIAGVVQAAKGRSARMVNAILARRGRLWQPGFHDRCLRSAQDVRIVARYVVANPLRAGLVRRVGDYPHWDAAFRVEGGETIWTGGCCDG